MLSVLVAVLSAHLYICCLRSLEVYAKEVYFCLLTVSGLQDSSGARRDYIAEMAE